MAEKTVKTRRMRMNVRGIVQGVGFRFFTVRAARQNGVSGWVRNLADGSVEIEAEGSDEELEAFVREIRKGPAMSRVDDITANEVPPQGEQEFRIE